MMGGRVKTLHPAIFGGILARRGRPEHIHELVSMGLNPIDMVVVNLYPFETTLARKEATEEEVAENIDIGGPSLIRAAAKNFEDVIVIVDPADYGRVLASLRTEGDMSIAGRSELAAKAFALTSGYDSAIFEWLRQRTSEGRPWGGSLRMRFEKVMDTRYGENPHQKGAYFTDPSYKGVSVANSEVLWGKELSFNNIYDTDAATDILLEFPGEPCCVIIKHNNPSGVALGPGGGSDHMAEAFERAFSADPLSAYGGIVGLNRECTRRTAELMGQYFFELVIAPSYAPEALDVLKRKKNLRILLSKVPLIPSEAPEKRCVKLKGGMLVQTMDWPPFDPSNWKVVTSKAPGTSEVKDLVFAMKVVKHVKSNCVVLAKDLCTVGVGAGQMSRVDSCFMAVHKAGGRSMGSVLASDAFFPFRDGIDILASGGVCSVAQPGGSIRDNEVIDAANNAGMSMVFTGLRQFKH
jgi:phosphoribosylaminoimidazolecarboxamide formyltransferase/IMP cyclohydrolase